MNSSERENRKSSTKIYHCSRCGEAKFNHVCSKMIQGTRDFGTQVDISITGNKFKKRLIESSFPSVDCQTLSSRTRNDQSLLSPSPIDQAKIGLFSRNENVVGTGFELQQSNDMAFSSLPVLSNHSPSLPPPPSSSSFPPHPPSIPPHPSLLRTTPNVDPVFIADRPSIPKPLYSPMYHPIVPSPQQSIHPSQTLDRGVPSSILRHGQYYDLFQANNTYRDVPSSPFSSIKSYPFKPSFLQLTPNSSLISRSALGPKNSISAIENLSKANNFAPSPLHHYGILSSQPLNTVDSLPTSMSHSLVSRPNGSEISFPYYYPYEFPASLDLSNGFQNVGNNNQFPPHDWNRERMNCFNHPSHPFLTPSNTSLDSMSSLAHGPSNGQSSYIIHSTPCYYEKNQFDPTSSTSFYQVPHIYNPMPLAENFWPSNPGYEASFQGMNPDSALRPANVATNLSSSTDGVAKHNHWAAFLPSFHSGVSLSDLTTVTNSTRGSKNRQWCSLPSSHQLYYEVFPNECSSASASASASVSASASASASASSFASPSTAATTSVGSTSFSNSSPSFPSSLSAAAAAAAVLTTAVSFPSSLAPIAISATSSSTTTSLPSYFNDLSSQVTTTSTTSSAETAVNLDMADSYGEASYDGVGNGNGIGIGNDYGNDGLSCLKPYHVNWNDLLNEKTIEDDFGRNSFQDDSVTDSDSSSDSNTP